jgi:hypothetical protein
VLSNLLQEGFVSERNKVSFDPKKFLARVGDGKTILSYQKNKIVFSQGEVAMQFSTSSAATSSSSSFPNKARKPSSLF